jgi:hypothetical protein
VTLCFLAQCSHRTPWYGDGECGLPGVTFNDREGLAKSFHHRQAHEGPQHDVSFVPPALGGQSSGILLPYWLIFPSPTTVSFPAPMSAPQ